MNEEQLLTLGESLKRDFQALIGEYTTGWLDHNCLTAEDLQELLALELESYRFFEVADEFLELDKWLSSGFIPTDLAALNHDSSGNIETGEITTNSSWFSQVKSPEQIPQARMDLLRSPHSLPAIVNTIPDSKLCFQTPPSDLAPPLIPPGVKRDVRNGEEKSVKVPRDIQSAASSGFPLKKGDGRGISLGDLGGSGELKTGPRIAKSADDASTSTWLNHTSKNPNLSANTESAILESQSIISRGNPGVVAPQVFGGRYGDTLPTAPIVGDNPKSQISNPKLDDTQIIAIQPPVTSISVPVSNQLSQVEPAKINDSTTQLTATSNETKNHSQLVEAAADNLDHIQLITQQESIQASPLPPHSPIKGLRELASFLEFQPAEAKIEMLPNLLSQTETSGEKMAQPGNYFSDTNQPETLTDLDLSDEVLKTQQTALPTSFASRIYSEEKTTPQLPLVPTTQAHSTKDENLFSPLFSQDKWDHKILGKPELDFWQSSLTDNDSERKSVDPIAVNNQGIPTPLNQSEPSISSLPTTLVNFPVNASFTQQQETEEAEFHVTEESVVGIAPTEVFELDMDLIMEAIAREINREYRRFYGD